MGDLWVEALSEAVIWRMCKGRGRTLPSSFKGQLGGHVAGRGEEEYGT